MKAVLIEYAYKDSEEDQCRGTRIWTVKQEAILIETENKKILVVTEDTKPYFFEVLSENADGKMRFGWRERYDMHLPFNGYRVLNKLDLNPKIFKAIVSIFEWKKCLKIMRDELEEIFKKRYAEKIRG